MSTEKERKYAFFKAVRDRRETDAIEMLRTGQAAAGWHHSSDGDTALHLAVKYDLRVLATELLDRGVDLTQSAHNGMTAAEWLSIMNRPADAPWDRLWATVPAPRESGEPAAKPEPGALLVPGVTYRVVGAAACRFFVPGQLVQLTQMGTDRTSRDEFISTLTFRNRSTGQEVTLGGSHTLEGLVPVLPEGAPAWPSKVRATAVVLTSGSVPDRVAAAGRLVALTDPWVLSLLWNQAFYDSQVVITPARDSTSVRRVVHQTWARANPAGVSFVEQGLGAGTLEPVFLVRRFLATAGSLYFFDTLVTELASTDPQVRRTAVEEIGIIGSAEFIPALEPLTDDENPAVAIKAAYALSNLKKTGDRR